MKRLGFVALVLVTAACAGGPNSPATLPPPRAVTPLPGPQVAVRLPTHAATFTPTPPHPHSPTPPTPAASPTFEPTPLPASGAGVAGSLPSNVAPPSAQVAALAASVFGASLPARIAIPAIGVDASVVPVGWHARDGVSVWDDPAFAAGFLVSGAAPGQGGNVVFYGHNNIKGSVFRRLAELKPGDAVAVTNGAAVWRYRVDQVTVFQEAGLGAPEQQANLAYFSPTPDERLTLLSCWPPTGNTHRVVVVARPGG